MSWKERCLFGCLFVRSHVFLLQWDDRSLQFSLLPYCQLHSKKSRCYQPQSLQNPTWIHVNSTKNHWTPKLFKPATIKNTTQKLQLFATSYTPEKKLRWIPPKKNAMFEAGNFLLKKAQSIWGVIPLQGLSSLVGERCVEGIDRWTATWSPVCFFFPFGKIILKKGPECCRWIIDSGKLT